MNYWFDEYNLMKKAKKHNKFVEEIYHKQILVCVETTRIYNPIFECTEAAVDIETTICLDDLDSVSAIYKHADGRTAVLNFASYKNPGGGFLAGSSAQEEALCHESILYSVLSRLMDKYYKWNHFNKNRELYLNRGLYTPAVCFIHDGKEKFCDVITVAAPNKKVATRYQNVTSEENYEVLRDRIKFVLDIAKDNKVDTLILGAYGCGVFGQDPMEVASIFKELLTTTHKCFKKVVFSIPDKTGRSYRAFEQYYH